MMDIARLSAALEGRYRIERELGQGGMATVYLAEDLKHDRKVALKVLKPELAAVLGADRFVVEIKTTASLQHPHILPLFDSGTAGGFLFYVMPYIEGETLRDRLNRETQLGVEEALRITCEVADALDYAHRHGVVHRDIKPENILLHDGRPMVADFGIALAVSAAAGGRMTETGLSLGTPHYMSPEQATADKELTGRSDIYSLGGVLYEMLAGDPPHTANSAQQVIMKIITEPARPVTELRASVPPNVAAAVAKALAKLPADRFESAAKFADALRNPAFTALVAPQAGAARSDAEAGTAAAMWRRVAFVATIVAGGSVLALAWSLSRSPQSRGPSEYDVGLPASAPVDDTTRVSFAVDPAGAFVVYVAVRDSGTELRYRSLLDASTRPIEGSDGAVSPAISPDGGRIAFLRAGDPDATIEVSSLDGGTPTVIGRSAPDGLVQWLPDGRVLVLDGDGNRARWLDPGGGTPVIRTIPYCILPSLLPDPQSLLCGGGGDQSAYVIDVGDSPRTSYLHVSAADSAPVFGSDFQVIEDRYLLWLSKAGDLLAAPVNLESRLVGKSVRMATGLGRQAYSGAGTYAVSRSGSLVWASGSNHASGYLVRTDDTSRDTLPFGREAFLRFNMSPDGRRVAAVVEVPEGEELRIYDAETGSYTAWQRHPGIRQPVWSPAGDRVTFRSGDSVFVGSPDEAGPPELLFTDDDRFEGFTWMSDDRLFGTLWDAPNLAAVAHLDRRPVTLDTLFGDASLVHPSPDGRWIAYTSADFGTVWLELLPRTGKRYQVATGDVAGGQWLSSTELVFRSRGGYERVSIDAAADPPLRNRRRWFESPRMIVTAGQSFSLTPDERVLYVEGAVSPPVTWLHVVPDWVAKMKHAVDEANR